MTSEIGCKAPISLAFDGSVISTFSSCNFLFSSASSNSLFFSSSSLSISLLTSFISAPNFGLSSGATSLIPFERLDIAPAFPKALTLTSFNSFKLVDFLMSPSSSSLIFKSSSIISPP